MSDHAAFIWLTTPRDTVILVKKKRPDARWGLPGGKAEDGEKPIQTVRREVREETNLKAQRVRRRCSLVITSALASDHTWYLYTGQVSDTSRMRPQVGEIREVREFTLDQIRTMRRNHTMVPKHAKEVQAAGFI